MVINHDRPVEKLRGENAGIVELRLSQIHVMTPILEAARAARPGKGLRNVPVALRRGWALHVIETHMRNRKLYLDVINGRI